MKTEEPRVVDSGRYGMSDAAKILGVARCTAALDICGARERRV